MYFVMSFSADRNFPSLAQRQRCRLSYSKLTSWTIAIAQPYPTTTTTWKKLGVDPSMDVLQEHFPTYMTGNVNIWVQSGDRTFDFCPFLTAHGPACEA